MTLKKLSNLYEIGDLTKDLDLVPANKRTLAYLRASKAALYNRIRLVHQKHHVYLSHNYSSQNSVWN